MAKRISKEVKQAAEDLLAVMKTDFGRRFVWNQLSECRVFHECFMPEQEGARRVGLELMRNLMLVCPTLYLQMQGEAMSLETRKRLEKEKLEEEKGEEDGRSE